MGILWAALDTRLQREVAVKEIIPPSGLEPEQQELFRTQALHEARAAARTTHPSAITVYDVVEEDGRPWIVMQLLSPWSLSDIVNDTGPLPPATAARIGLDLLDVLVAAHEAGVLHRDVKPGNVLFRDGQAVLVDFGIASVDDAAVTFSTEQLLGSPAFMPPERARGDALTLASDLWSLGATLFAAVEGRAPFHRSSPLATLAAVLTEDPPPAQHAGPLRPALTALLAKDPEARPSAGRTRDLLLRAVTAPDGSDHVGDVVGAWLAIGGTTNEPTRGLPPPRGAASPRGLATAAAAIVAASLLLVVPTAAVLIHHVDSTAPSAAGPPASGELSGSGQEPPARAPAPAGPRTGQLVPYPTSRPRAGGAVAAGAGLVEPPQQVPTTSATPPEQTGAASEPGDRDDQGEDGDGARGGDCGHQDADDQGYGKGDGQNGGGRDAAGDGHGSEANGQGGKVNGADNGADNGDSNVAGAGGGNDGFTASGVGQGGCRAIQG
jgi:eukaryotic-like serine/threonine-protein kinase